MSKPLTPLPAKPGGQVGSPAPTQAGANAAPAAGAAPSASTSTKTFDLRVPKKIDRKVFVSKFSNSLGVDFALWKKNPPEFVREGATEEAAKVEDDTKSAPKVGAGSEYGKDKRDEARRRRYTRVKNPADAPWIMTDTMTQKKYRGTKEGGVQDNSSYYVFTTLAGRIEAYPISEWFNFVPVQRYKALNTEEAEEAFGRRDKVMNYFSLMYKKRLGKGDEGDEEEPGSSPTKGAGGGKGRKSNLKIRDDGEDGPGEMSDSDDEEGAAGDTEAVATGKKKGPGRKAKPKAVPKKVRKKERGDDEDDREPAEDSDDGDYETREVDYETSDTEEEDTKAEDEDGALKGVDEEVQEMEDEEDEEDEDKEEVEKEKQDGAADDNGGGSESDNEEEDIDALADSLSVIPHAKKPDAPETSATASTSAKKDKPPGSSPPKGKRKLENESPVVTKRKQTTGEGSSAASVSAPADGKLDEEALVRRYLSRKPFTSKELLRKLTKHGIKAEDISSRLGEIIKRLNPEKTNINGKLYLHLRA